MRRCRPLLGTLVEVDCDRPAAIDSAFAEIERVHRLMSAHEPESELSRVNRFAHLQAVQVSNDTAIVLRSALGWYRRSGGAFDAVRAGARALQRGGLPCHPNQPAPEAADSGALHLDGDCVRLDKPACVDLGGIAKGYAVDLAVAALRAGGASTGVVNAGGDLRAFGDAAYPVMVVEPAARSGKVEVALRDAALATSAGLASNGTLSFDHLATSNASWTSVTVQAASAMTADALAKIIWALGDEACSLLRETGAQAFAMCSDGSVEAVGDRVLAA